MTIPGTRWQIVTRSVTDWQTRASVLLRKLDHQLNWRGADLDTLDAQTALLLQELNRELGENEEANDVKGR